MLFGEKYGESVRIITFDDAFSKELCGGCHVKATGEIGLFKLVSEGSVASGIRRIEALTGQAALDYVQKEAAQLQAVRQALKNPKDLDKAVADLLQSNKQMQKELEKMALLEAKLAKGDLEAKVQAIGGFNFLGATTSIVSKDGLKQLSNSLHQSVPNLVLVLGGENKGKALLTVSVDGALADKFHAGKLVKAIAKHVNGGGGGKPVYATAGGKNPAGLDAALQAAKALVEEQA
jgi:alanyl-tRNA synthetase